MIYGDKYEQQLKKAEDNIKQARNASASGDLWEAYEELHEALLEITAAIRLLKEVSKVAFERVLKEKV